VGIRVLWTTSQVPDFLRYGFVVASPVCAVLGFHSVTFSGTPPFRIWGWLGGRGVWCVVGGRVFDTPSLSHAFSGISRCRSTPSSLPFDGSASSVFVWCCFCEKICVVGSADFSTCATPSSVCMPSPCPGSPCSKGSESIRVPAGFHYACRVGTRAAIGRPFVCSGVPPFCSTLECPVLVVPDVHVPSSRF